MGAFKRLILLFLSVYLISNNFLTAMTSTMGPVPMAGPGAMPDLSNDEVIKMLDDEINKYTQNMPENEKITFSMTLARP